MSESESLPAAAATDTSLEDAVAVIRRVGIGARVRFLAAPIGEGFAANPLPYSARVDQMNRAGIWLEYLEGQDVPLRTAILWPDANYTYTEIKVLPPFATARPLAAREEETSDEQTRRRPREPAESPQRRNTRTRTETEAPMHNAQAAPAATMAMPAAAPTPATPSIMDMCSMFQQLQSLLALAVSRPSASTAPPVNLSFSASQVEAAIRSRSRALVETSDLVINVPRAEPERQYRCLCPQIYIEPMFCAGLSARDAETQFIQDLLVLRTSFKEKYPITDMAGTMLDGIAEQFVSFLRQLRPAETLPSQIPWDIAFRIIEQLLRQFAVIKNGNEGLKFVNEKIAEGRRTTEFDFPGILMKTPFRNPKNENNKAGQADNPRRPRN